MAEEIITEAGDPCGTVHTVRHGSPRILTTRSAATTPGTIFMDFNFSF